MKRFLLVLFFVLSLGSVGSALAQCAQGIPPAGNPDCLPPSAPNSPYNLGTDKSSAVGLCGGDSKYAVVYSMYSVAVRVQNDGTAYRGC